MTTAGTKPIPNALASGRLPRPLPRVLLGASILVMLLIFLLVWVQDVSGEYNIVGAVFFGYVARAAWRRMP